MRGCFLRYQRPGIKFRVDSRIMIRERKPQLFPQSGCAIGENTHTPQRRFGFCIDIFKNQRVAVRGCDIHTSIREW